MSRIRQIYVAAIFASLLVGCSGDVMEPDTLESAIRAAGYPCTGVVDSTEIGEGTAAWRVQCQDALTYTADLFDDDRICVVPVANVDAVFGEATRQRPIDERCVSSGEI